MNCGQERRARFQSESKLVSCGNRLKRWTGAAVAGLLAIGGQPSGVVWAQGTAAETTDGAPSYNRDVRPILADKCFACHGFDAETREADLRLDTFEGATADNAGTRAIVPGKLEESELWNRINSQDESEVMPPPETHKQLTAEEIATLRRWIESGAAYQKHWSFEPPLAHAVPPLPSGGRNPIDAFIAQRMEREGWKLSPEADKSTLIRRVAFALTGLPPTPAELDTFLADNSSTAYEAMVDRYLASPHYGEEMARHWLDVARYADTHGLHLDNERQTWAYRDWVVKSFNRNQPFSEFTIEQLAGDLLPKPSLDQLVATGFNRCNVTSSEGGSIDAEYHFRYAVDRASTTASAWMGLTAGCAVCHDHKFDPISAKEFYSLYAFFNASADPAMDGNALLTNPVLKLESDADKAKLAELDARLAELQKRLDDRLATYEYRDPALANPAPEATVTENVWLEDDFPTGGRAFASPGAPTQFVSRGGSEQVYSGERALKRTDAGLAQDVWEQAPAPLVIPAGAQIFAYVYLDPSNPPKSVMLQFHRTGWQHRAVWGDYNAIDWGAANTTERVSMGELPPVGQWTRLEIPVEKVGLNPGDQLTGFAMTQFGGTVYWDKVGVVGSNDPAKDPSQSFLAWWRSAKGKDTPGLPGDLNAIAKTGPKEDETQGPAKPAAAELDENGKKLLGWYVSRICSTTKPEFEAAINEQNQVRGERDTFYNAIPSTFIYKDAAQPRESFVMLRGQYNQPGEKVLPDVPAILPPMKRGEGQPQANRLDLARWLVAPEHPLTARVTANRFWQQFFGVGLVKTSADFGTQGELPSHPELLDWLALHYQETGWDTKELVKLMLCSATFRQSSRVTSEQLERDPENRLLARGPRLRLDAEQLRDNALFVSGLIDLTMGGKGVKPYQPANVWEPVGFAGSNTRFYSQDNGSALYRRSIYTFFKRTAPPPFMVNFDVPNREQSCTRRERSNTPLQALQLLNDVQHVEAARALAQRALTSGGADGNERIRFLFRTVLAREPQPVELEILSKQLDEHLTRYRASEEDARKLVMQGDSKPDAAIPAGELAAYTLLASTVLNLDETVMRN